MTTRLDLGRELSSSSLDDPPAVGPAPSPHEPVTAGPSAFPPPHSPRNLDSGGARSKARRALAPSADLRRCTCGDVVCRLSGQLLRRAAGSTHAAATSPARLASCLLDDATTMSAARPSRPSLPTPLPRLAARAGRSGAPFLELRTACAGLAAVGRRHRSGRIGAGAHAGPTSSSLGTSTNLIRQAEEGRKGRREAL